jgi:chaperone BCS1
MDSKAMEQNIESEFPPQNRGNISLSDTVPGLSPTTLLETFIPGYISIHKFLLVTFGFDATSLAALGFFLWLVTRTVRFVCTQVSKNCMAEITVGNEDKIFGELIKFIADKSESSRRLIAKTLNRSAWELDSEERLRSTTDSKGNKWLNFSNQETKSQPQFTPAIGSHNFWFGGKYFRIQRKEVSMFKELGNGATTLTGQEYLKLSCFGWSTEPIKKLIQRAREHYSEGHEAKTVIKRPAPKDMRRGGRASWVKVAERPCRPMETVVLDAEHKNALLLDINEYLHPATAIWYANRGIPYRRGYLFYGPPGTGKTSLTFAIAGVFGLDIYVISLLEPTLTEEELGNMFASLPARCIVLLEDIDAAGLSRDSTDVDGKNTVSDVGNLETIMNLAKALQKANQFSEEDKKKGISLSGLLNIIDGKSPPPIPSSRII